MKYPKEFYDRARKQLAEINQFFLDIDHWNNEHPNEKINPDEDGQVRMLKRRMETVLKS